ncbi:MAG: OmpH family outer membrane protein [Ignavibacteriae bacterium]|nr:MAG: OmpH family outer membrane protein [Ignavibacteriota bacterium]
MKVKVFFLFILMFVSSNAFSQAKIGYVDSKVILEKLQDAADAQKNLDNLVQLWKTEVQHLTDSLAAIKDDYEKKKLILTDNVKKQREEGIETLERKISDYKLSKFGENGEYFVKQTELMKPVQDKVFKAIQDVAKEGGYDFVFDRSSEIILLYMNDKYDLTSKVIKRLETM